MVIRFSGVIAVAQDDSSECNDYFAVCDVSARLIRALRGTAIVEFTADATNGRVPGAIYHGELVEGEEFVVTQKEN